MRTGTMIGLAMAWAGFLWCAPLAAQQPPVAELEMELRLVRALGTGTDVEEPAGWSLLVDVARLEGGEWDRAWAMECRSRRMRVFTGRITSANVSDERVNLSLELIGHERDGRLPGGFDVRASGVIRIEVELSRDGDEGLTGRYTATRRDAVVTGEADGRVKPRRPALPAAFVPVQPGDRPRILFRASDLPALREKAQTPLGQALLEQMGREGSNDAVGAAARYQITGDAQYAERARQFTERQMRGHEGLYSHRSGRGRPPQHVALAYDLCYDAWPDDFKREVEDWLIATARLIREGRYFVGGNHHVCSNWSSHIYGAKAFIALALWGEGGQRPAEPTGEHAEWLRPFWEMDVAHWQRDGRLDPNRQRMLEQGRYMMYAFHREGAGTGGFHGENAHYGAHAMVMPMEFAVAYRQMFGSDVSPWPDMTHVVARRVFSQHYPETGRPEPLEINGLNALTGQHPFIDIGFPIAPDAWKPAVLWAWNRVLGLEGPQDAAQREQINLSGGQSIGHAIWFFLNYPLDMEPAHPDGVLPLTWEAPDFGYFGFRSGWQPDRAHVLQVFAKSQRAGGWNGPNAGTFRLFGRGVSWNETSSDRAYSAWGENRVMMPDDAVHEGGRGRVTHRRFAADGSGAVSIDMSDLYNSSEWADYSMYGNIRYPGPQARAGAQGARALRAVAVDYAGDDCVFVLVDRVEGGGEKVWTWNLGGANRLGDVEVEDNTFAIRRGDAILYGTFVAPQAVRIALEEKERLGLITARGGDAFYVVATIVPADAPRPEFTVEGEGLDARVRVNGRTVRFDGQSVEIRTTPREAAHPHTERGDAAGNAT